MVSTAYRSQILPSFRSLFSSPFCAPCTFGLSPSSRHTCRSLLSFPNFFSVFAYPSNSPPVLSFFGHLGQFSQFTSWFPVQISNQVSSYCCLSVQFSKSSSLASPRVLVLNRNAITNHRPEILTPLPLACSLGYCTVVWRSTFWTNQISSRRSL